MPRTCRHRLLGKKPDKDVAKEIARVNGKYGSAFGDLEEIVRFYKAFDEWSFGREGRSRRRPRP